MDNKIYKNTLVGQCEEVRKAWNNFVAVVVKETKDNKVKKFLKGLNRHDHDTDKRDSVSPDETGQS